MRCKQFVYICTNRNKNEKIEIMIITEKIETIEESFELARKSAALLKSDVIMEFNDTDEIDSVIISFSKRLQKFVLELNGELVHSSKTFKSLMSKTEQLIKERNLSKMTLEQF